MSNKPIDTFILEFVAKHQLNDAFATSAKQHFLPLAKSILQLYKTKLTTSLTKAVTPPLFVGINGCQGSGKSTLTELLTCYFCEYLQLNVVNLSLDDFYLSKLKRKELSRKIHPLLVVRGVPGTHDIQTLRQTLISLKQQKLPINIPRFNKAIDDIYPTTQWLTVEKKADIVLLEGWCWGAQPQTKSALIKAINTLEKTQDADASWRQYVNQTLASSYVPLYEHMDFWLMLQAPSFESVSNWRWQQEQKLSNKVSANLSNTSFKSKRNEIMTKTEIETFIEYFQRLTEHALITLPEQCDWIFQLDEQRNIKDLINKLNI